MTTALLKATNTVDLPSVEGVSDRAVRIVMGVYAKISAADGSMRWGISARKIAELTRYSIRVVRRAQAALLDAGLLYRRTQGGGRRSTHWGIDLQRLLGRPSEPDQGHTSDDDPAPQPSQSVTPQERRPRLFSRLSLARSAPSGMSAAPDEICPDHDSPGGLLPDGRQRCPSCRRIGAGLMPPGRVPV